MIIGDLKMSERVYDRLANVFMLIAVVSALSFNSIGSWQWVAGGIGVAAGVAAVVLYFTNQSRNADKQPNVPTEKDVTAAPMEEHSQDPLTLGETWAVGLGRKSFERYIRVASLAWDPKTAIRVFDNRNLVHDRMLSVHWNTYHEAVMQIAEQREEVALSTEQIASCAIEIIRELSSGEDRGRWKFSFGAKGLSVYPSTGSEDQGTMEEQPSIERFDLESAPMSETIQ